MWPRWPGCRPQGHCLWSPAKAPASTFLPGRYFSCQTQVCCGCTRRRSKPSRGNRGLVLLSMITWGRVRLWSPARGTLLVCSPITCPTLPALLLALHKAKYFGFLSLGSTQRKSLMQVVLLLDLEPFSRAFSSSGEALCFVEHLSLGCFASCRDEAASRKSLCSASFRGFLFGVFLQKLSH